MPEKLAFSDSWVLLGGFGGNAMVDHKADHRANGKACGSDLKTAVAVVFSDNAADWWVDGCCRDV